MEKKLFLILAIFLILLILIPFSYAYFLAPIKDDPDIIFSTYFGGSGEDFASCMAEGYSNEIYIAGQTQSTDLPVKQKSIRIFSWFTGYIYCLF